MFAPAEELRAQHAPCPPRSTTATVPHARCNPCYLPQINR